jgi:hypothetical protein
MTTQKLFNDSMMVVLIRSMHGLITAYFLACIGMIYYSALTNRPTLWAFLAALSLMIEGLVVYLNNGDCPLGKLHQHYGDEKAFFELIMPAPLAKRAVPFFGSISIIGILLLVWNCMQ